MAIEIVDFPMKNGGSFHSYVNLPEAIFNLSFLHIPSPSAELPRLGVTNEPLQQISSLQSFSWAKNMEELGFVFGIISNIMEIDDDRCRELLVFKMYRTQ